MLSEKQTQRLSEEYLNVLTPPIPKELFLEVNNTCNLVCHFCANSKMTRSKEFINDDLAKRVMDEAFALGVTDISFYATGEPFLFPRLSEYVRYAKNKGYGYVFITTNGVAADIELAKDVIDAGLDSVKFSINAGTRDTYRIVHGKDKFEAVIANVKAWDEYRKKTGSKLKMYVSMVPTQISMGDYDKLMDAVGDCLDQQIDIRSCSNQGGNMLENNTFEKIDPRNILGTLKTDQLTSRCPDPFNRIVVSSEGYMTACVVDYQNALVVSDLRNESLLDAWSGKKFQQLRKRHIDGDLHGLICYNCLNNAKDKFESLDERYFRPLKPEKDLGKVYEKKNK